jgi:hypothetical protein
MLRNWKTTAAFGLSALFAAIANIWPDQSGWATPMSQATLFIAGVNTRDSGNGSDQQ